jgi:Acetamidase/Formamidase family
MAGHVLSVESTRSRWDRALPPRLTIAPGDTVHVECVDTSGAQVRPGMSVADYLTIDRGRIHALTGPIFVEGGEPGDVLQNQGIEGRAQRLGLDEIDPRPRLSEGAIFRAVPFHWTLNDEVTPSREKPRSQELK